MEIQIELFHTDLYSVRKYLIWKQYAVLAKPDQCEIMAIEHLAKDSGRVRAKDCYYLGLRDDEIKIRKLEVVYPNPDGKYSFIKEFKPRVESLHAEPEVVTESTFVPCDA
jgi:hypothetical protein